MQPATPSSVMGDSEAALRAGRAEKDAGTTIFVPPEQMRRAVAGYAPGVASELAHEIHDSSALAGYERADITDVLIASLFRMPEGYDPHPKNRHARRRNKAILRDGYRLPIVAARHEAGAAYAIVG